MSFIYLERGIKRSHTQISSCGCLGTIKIKTCGLLHCIYLYVLLCRDYERQRERERERLDVHSN